MQPKKLNWVIIPLYIGVGLNFIIAIAFITSYNEIFSFIFSIAGNKETVEILAERNRDFFDSFLKNISIGMSVMYFAYGVFGIIVVQKLKQRKYWAWISALVISAFYIGSIFVFLGIPMIIGVLNEEVKEWVKNKD